MNMFLVRYILFFVFLFYRVNIEFSIKYNYVGFFFILNLNVNELSKGTVLCVYKVFLGEIYKVVEYD